MLRAFGGHYLGIPNAVEGGVVFLGVSVPYQRLLILLIAGASLATVWFVLHRTRLGLAIRATANDLEVANLMGMDVRNVAMATMAISVALAAVAGVSVAPVFVVDPFMWLAPLVTVLSVVVPGGSGSLKGRLAAAQGIWAVYAASGDLLAGYAGQVSFGHARFFGAGAYSSALASLELGIPPWLGVLLGAAVASAAGVAVGYLCLRLRGSYLSLATLAFPLITLGILFAFPERSGGELGVSGVRSILSSRMANYYLIAAVMLALVYALWAIADSRFGLGLHAIRDDEVAARASGINTPRYKLGALP